MHACKDSNPAFRHMVMCDESASIYGLCLFSNQQKNTSTLIEFNVRQGPDY